MIRACSARTHALTILHGPQPPRLELPRVETHSQACSEAIRVIRVIRVVRVVRVMRVMRVMWVMRVMRVIIRRQLE